MRIPHGIAIVLNAFSALFAAPTWRHMQVLSIGAILCQGARRISSVLCITGFSQEKRFEKYHRVFNRAQWNSLQGAKILLGLLLQLLPASFPLLIVVDDTIERRSGKKITAKGYYRNAAAMVRKSHSQNDTITHGAILADMLICTRAVKKYNAAHIINRLVQQKR